MNKKNLPPFSAPAQSIKAGSFYEHYKGFRYKVIGVARHSETLEELVVYQALYGEGGTRVRPVTMFLENIDINGQFPYFGWVLNATSLNAGIWLLNR